MGHKPLYVLDPAKFAALVNKPNLFTGTVVQHVLRAINQLLVLRRTMSTEIEMGDGTSEMIGNDVQSYSTSAVELAWGSEVKREDCLDAYDTYIGCLNIPGAGQAGGAPLQRPTSDPSGLRNGRVHRILHAVAHDPRNVKVFARWPRPTKPKIRNQVAIDI